MRVWLKVEGGLEGLWWGGILVGWLGGEGEWLLGG